MKKIILFVIGIITLVSCEPFEFYTNTCPWCGCPLKRTYCNDYHCLDYNKFYWYCDCFNNYQWCGFTEHHHRYLYYNSREVANNDSIIVDSIN